MLARWEDDATLGGGSPPGNRQELSPYPGLTESFGAQS
jgi:hypothetical protein